jgi:YceI-like domain
MEGTTGGRTHFDVVPERSAVLIRARSNVGPIEFGMVGLTGFIDASLDGDRVVMDGSPAASLDLEIRNLRSGNQLYDAELLRRIDARRYPTATVELEGGAHATDARYHLVGRLRFHGFERSVEGSVSASRAGDGTIIVEGDHVFDIRDFDISMPTMFLLKIYPDVRVELHVEAEAQPTVS